MLNSLGWPWRESLFAHSLLCYVFAVKGVTFGKRHPQLPDTKLSVLYSDCIPVSPLFPCSLLGSMLWNLARKKHVCSGIFSHFQDLKA
jgi:hypothetical protein